MRRERRGKSKLSSARDLELRLPRPCARPLSQCGSEGENLYKWCYGAGALGITIGALNIFTAVLDYKTTEENATRLALFRTVLLLMNVTTLTFECGWSIWGIVIAYAHHDELGAFPGALGLRSSPSSRILLPPFLSCPQPPCRNRAPQGIATRRWCRRPGGLPS